MAGPAARKTTRHDPCVPSWCQARAGGSVGIDIGSARRRPPVRKDTWVAAATTLHAVVVFRARLPRQRIVNFSSLKRERRGARVVWGEEPCRAG
ncbi:hypothetical protein E2562_009279 [Oryza meyeriana var. granulata]|uniref:Uncharacterized protein n=1 Tax=Oryza meyeriana var. granulata TaxID=110450 RepID=A0A6G1E9R9_9ORYZ|nr:hypothetical protein E2562_009279 [Oryza meyeriana var. granulata]